MTITVLLRGGGDLASGVALRLHRAGMRVAITELEQPKVVRRYVAFAQAVFDGEIEVEGVRAVRAGSPGQAIELLSQGLIPVLVDPQAECRGHLAPHVLVDGRMLKHAPDLGLDTAPLVIGLGPGFTAGEHCHAVIETKRGPTLGRVIWRGGAEADSGSPDSVGEHRDDRVLRAPAAGRLEAAAQIGDHIQPGQVIASVEGEPIYAPFAGRLRGLMMTGLQVQRNEKVGDLDPRDEPVLCFLVSDKALAIGGAALEAILSRPELRKRLAQ